MKFKTKQRKTSKNYQTQSQRQKLQIKKQLQLRIRHWLNLLLNTTILSVTIDITYCRIERIKYVVKAQLLHIFSLI